MRRTLIILASIILMLAATASAAQAAGPSHDAFILFAVAIVATIGGLFVHRLTAQN